MRRQYFNWTWLVLSLVLTIYGGYSLIYNNANGKELSVLGLTFFIIGLVLLILYLVLLLITIYQKKKNNHTKEEIPSNEKVVETKETKIEVEPIKENKVERVEKNIKRNDIYYKPYRSSSSSDDGGSGYVRKIGYGPVLRITNNEILDMRSNTYYRIEGNIIKMSGSGPVYEISSNRIKLAFGGYLYEISGNSINKIYGGFYASISGGYLQTFDLSEKYEIPTDLNAKQKLAVVALLFGTY